jgi:hypothetical protein
MGGEWFESDIWLGIRFPRNKVRVLWNALKGEDGHLKGASQEFPVTIKFYERERHSRYEFEQAEELMYRCTGFLGIVMATASVDKLAKLQQELVAYLDANKEILSKFKITDLTPMVLGGILNNLSDCFEILGRKRKHEDDIFYDENEGFAPKFGSVEGIPSGSEPSDDGASEFSGEDSSSDDQ